MVERMWIFKDKYENNRKDWNFFTAKSMVHKYVETTPETVISQLQMLGHANCTNTQKIFLEKVDPIGCYSSTIEMDTSVGENGMAMLFFEPCLPYQYRFATKTWQSYPKNLSMIALLVL